MEIWKDVVGYEGSYMVSNLGRVKTLHWRGSKVEKILCEKKHTDGYLFVELYKNNTRKPITIHRLVAIAFIDNPQNLPCINHKDENKKNNKVDNLEWCTRKENTNYGTTQKRRAETVRTKHMNEKRTVIQYDENMNEVARYQNQRKAVEANDGYKLSNIYNSIYKGQKAYGFYWKFEDWLSFQK